MDPITTISTHPLVPNMTEVKSSDKPAAMYAKGFEMLPTRWSIIPQYICKYVWSPSTYSGGHRKQSNHISTHVIGLDFDDPTYSVIDAKRKWRDNIHIIGLTKSHQTEKRGVTCDRFRVLLLAENIMTDIYTVKTTLAAAAAGTPADSACFDAARFFWPCQEIVSCITSGKKIKVEQPVAQATYNNTADHKRKAFEETGEYPDDITWFLTEGTLFSPRDALYNNRSRNCSTYETACYLWEIGEAEQLITDLLMAAPLDYDDDFNGDVVWKIIQRTKEKIQAKAPKNPRSEAKILHLNTKK